MGIYAELVGNVLASPMMKQINTAGGTRRIVELRVMSASYRRLDDGTLEQRDGRTFPVDVTVWSERLSERVMQHIRTGASIVVRGDLYVSPWINRDNEADAGVHIDAESIALNLVRIDQIVYRPRQPRESEQGSPGESAEDVGAVEAEGDHGDAAQQADPSSSDEPEADASTRSTGRRSPRTSNVASR
ncbi:single-stranded DNA-binding protein [Paraburkholderia heleia]|uniref:single-stranded DNA-binding protein n=1 Tax=Paraburkholderia heleia TaxID=634127 RepID=UPI0031DB6FB5